MRRESILYPPLSLGLDFTSNWGAASATRSDVPRPENPIGRTQAEIIASLQETLNNCKTLIAQGSEETKALQRALRS
jgi:hypothetical protein